MLILECKWYGVGWLMGKMIYQIIDNDSQWTMLCKM